MDTTLLGAYIRSYASDLAWTLGEFDQDVLARIIGCLASARDDGRQILLVGNGGSAAAASHMATDLGKGTINFADPSFRRFRVISLADNQALITALGNDLSFEDVFVEQLKIVMREGDVVILISASGNSPNLVKAAAWAKASGAVTIGLLGFGGGKLAGMVDLPLVVTSRNYGIAEDFHMAVQHVFTQYLRRALAGPARPVAFLDRDGIINERPAAHTYVQQWQDFRFRPGAIEMLQGLAAEGYALAVVSNQQGIGKGLMTQAAVHDIHERMKTELATHGVTLAGVFVCPHLADRRCFCRKPEPGLIHRALNELPFLVDLPRSAIIGDAPGDVTAGRAAGVPTRVLVSSQSANDATHRVDDLGAVRAVLHAARA